MELLRQRLDKEYEQVTQLFTKEVQRLHHSHQAELEKRVSCCARMVIDPIAYSTIPGKRE